MKRNAAYPTKTSMNLFYKPDRTTKPATLALYVLFALVVLLGLGKFLVYDLWAENQQAQRSLTSAQNELNGVMSQLADYNDVQNRYFRYSATDEERAIVDRMEVLAMLETLAGNAGLNTIAISGDRVSTQLSNVTLAQIAEIVNRLEASPLVAGTVVSTAATTGADGVDGDLVQANITIQLQKEGK